MAKILLVSKRSFLSMRIKYFLQLQGSYLHRATSLCEAWILLGQDRFDLILVDSQVGDESGIDFCYSIRHRAGEAALVLMGKESDADMVIRGKLTGVSDILKHPFTQTQLLRVVNRNLFSPLRARGIGWSRLIFLGRTKAVP